MGRLGSGVGVGSEGMELGSEGSSQGVGEVRGRVAIA